jgi:predicted nucleic acid-binding protein
MAPAFLDTNIILRHLLQDHAEHSPRATAYLRQIEDGLVRVRTSEIVIFETVFTLQRWARRPKDQIRDVVLRIIDLPGIVLPGKRRLHKAFDLYVRHNVAFADAYHAVLMEQLKLKEIVSFDTDFDRLPGIGRTEP